MSEPEFPITTHGPDRYRGGPHCRTLLNRDTVNEADASGRDWCCCCDPCYEATQPGFLKRCCSCVPSVVCFYFTKDDDNVECCQSFGIFAFAAFSETSYQVKYTADFDEFVFNLYMEPIDSEALDSPCQWKIECLEFDIEAVIPIDGVTTTCGAVPEFVIDNISFDSGCHGTISLSRGSMAKVRFVNTLLDGNGNEIDLGEDYPIPNSPCNCISAARFLCVGGIRHTDQLEAEYVHFSWREDMGDRWEYLPVGGDPSTDREVIYLRGDDEGNCYLELDFEQSGPDTNDWADPPNTFDANNPTHIRDGMIRVRSCGCGIFAKSYLPDGRYVRIHRGLCGRYKYKCGDCRCVPEYLCMVVFLGEEMARASAIWDADEQAWYSDSLDMWFRLGLDAEDNVSCVIQATNENLPNSFDPTPPLECGAFLGFLASSTIDPEQPLQTYRIWATGSLCGCSPTPLCGICPSRCGGPPDTLYVEFTYGIRDSDPPMGLPVFECSWTATIMFWQQVAVAPLCGYIGWTIATCEERTYLIQVELRTTVNHLFVTLIDIDTGAIEGVTELPYDLADPNSCDPYLFDVWDNETGAGSYHHLVITE